ncbi:MAG TPA: dicarboxylate/amino acid:cation symporter [Gemmatimonadales bacterium]|nr:dicarboxylate/amino acid:cation symporter [Gemmatimonadales bacterium]
MRRLSLNAWILIGLGAGIVFGAAAPQWGVALQPLATIFLRLIKLIVAPLVFSTLVLGLAHHTGILRMGLKSLIWFEGATTVALGVGLLMANLFKPGQGVSLPSGAAPAVGPPRRAADLLVHTIPESFADAWARNDVLQVAVFAILFGAAVGAVGAQAKPVVDLCEAAVQILFRLTRLVMKVAPVGVFAAIAASVGTHGLGVLLPLAKLIGVFYLALGIFATLLLAAARVLFRVPTRAFWSAARPAVTLAFSTASSESALPLAMERMERYGVPREVVGFVIPAGYSFNLDGSTLYLSLASLFIAQAAGITFGIREQLVLMLTLMVTSKGVAGVPRSVLVILAGAVASFHLPIEGVALLLGIDSVLDMGRTAINVLGNCLASAVIDRWEHPDGERAGRGSEPSLVDVDPGR